jgi:WhiB family redox-sensing transcriptional regulator
MDVDLFFPEDGGKAKTTRLRLALQICRSCDVRPACLAYALRRGEEFGIWGGATAEDRRRIRQPPAQPATGNGQA